MNSDLVKRTSDRIVNFCFVVILLIVLFITKGCKNIQSVDKPNFVIIFCNDMGNDRDKNNPPLPLMRNETIIEAPVDQSTITQRYTAEAKADIGDYQREGANARPAGWVEKPEFLLVKEN